MSATKSQTPDDAYSSGWIDGWHTDRLLTLSEWADENIILSSKDSAEPGTYRTARTPYVHAIQEALSPSTPYESVVFIAGAQVGKTRVGLNWIGYVVDVTPGPMLMVQPTVEMAKKVSKQRLASMIETTTALRDKIAEARSRDSGNTMFEKEFQGGMLMLTGANSAVGLRSMPIRFLFLDEVDAYPGDVDGEGDPVELARKRTATFSRRKILMTSTPTIKGLSRIEAEFLKSDQRRFYVPCPHCGYMDWIRWERIVFDENDPGTARLRCTACHEDIDESHKTAMLEAGEWRATAEASDPKVVGFHVSALYAPLGWRSWSEIVTEFLAAKADPVKLKTWVNTVLGETWEEQGDSIDADSLKARLEDYDAEIPAGVGVLTAAVDVQGDRLEVAVKGWGAAEESWLIFAAQVPGDPLADDTWQALDQYLLDTYRHASGRDMTIRVVAVDSSAYTDTVYKQVKARSHRRVAGQPQDIYPIKGVSGPAREIVARPSKKNRYAVALYPVGVDTAKDAIFNRYRILQPGPGYLHLPVSLDDEYLAQMTAEKAIRKYQKGVGTVRQYIKIRERNEGLDLEVYNLAALHILGRRTIAKLRDLADAMNLPPDHKTDAATADEQPADQAPTKPRASWFGGGGGGWTNGWR